MRGFFILLTSKLSFVFTSGTLALAGTLKTFSNLVIKKHIGQYTHQDKLFYNLPIVKQFYYKNIFE
jgi:hypothetical protein